MTETTGAIIFCRILAPPQCPPPPSPDASILNYLDNRERRRHYPCRILVPQCPPPPTPQYLTIFMIERGGALIFCRILAPSNAPHPSPDATILNYLHDREGGAIIFCRILAPSNAHPLPRRHNTELS